MKAQSAGAFELHFTSTARVGPLVGVHQLVGLEVGVLGEPFLANVALVRLLTRVESQMRLQGRGHGETLGAKFAFKRTVNRVHPHMVSEVAQVGETIRTNVALVLSRVHHAVVMQSG